ncbi:MAG: Spy/CpxP family protein refolding chaperone [Candidatus Omnitrophica bacterium]|nr:Spy/CpxP family protein refolding chaperone [Candidatus Omnitrophota bacterium]
MKNICGYGITVWGLIGMLVLSTPAYAFGDHGWGSHGKKGRGGFGGRKEAMIEKIINELGLTDQQKTQIEQHRLQMKTQREKSHEEFFAKHKELRDELQKPEVDRAKIDQLITELSVLETRRLKDRVDGILAIRSILTPEQFSELHKKMKEHRKMFMNKRQWERSYSRTAPETPETPTE